MATKMKGATISYMAIVMTRFTVVTVYHMIIAFYHFKEDTLVRHKSSGYSP